MARRPKKFFLIWVLLVVIALYPQFSRMLSELGYQNPEHFFEDLVAILLGLSLVIIPFCLYFLFRGWRYKRREPVETFESKDTRRNSTRRK